MVICLDTIQNTLSIFGSSAASLFPIRVSLRRLCSDRRTYYLMGTPSLNGANQYNVFVRALDNYIPTIYLFNVLFVSDLNEYTIRSMMKLAALLRKSGGATFITQMEIGISKALLLP